MTHSRPLGRRRASASLLLGTLLLAVVPCVSLAAQDLDPLSKLDGPSKFNVQLLIDSAQAAGLPGRSLMSTALEGIAMKVDGKRIVVAVRRQYSLLQTARASLGPAGDEELTAAAAVLEAGAKPAALVAFRSRQNGRSDLEAFTIWADLITRGVPKDDASSAITKLWQDGADDATFHSLWNNVQTDILQGLNPGTALQNRIRETPGRAPPGPGKPPEGQQENQRSK
ncbi:MAG: hypothetical protein ACHQWU_03780 [Gemmatimonadales bacterium]